MQSPNKGEIEISLILKNFLQQNVRKKITYAFSEDKKYMYKIIEGIKNNSSESYTERYKKITDTEERTELDQKSKNKSKREVGKYLIWEPEQYIIGIQKIDDKNGRWEYYKFNKIIGDDKR